MKKENGGEMPRSWGRHPLVKMLSASGEKRPLPPGGVAAGIQFEKSGEPVRMDRFRSHTEGPEVLGRENPRLVPSYRIKLSFSGFVSKRPVLQVLDHEMPRCHVSVIMKDFFYPLKIDFGVMYESCYMLLLILVTLDAN